ncbi:hypothetical protein BGX38DRAFT_1224894 [Terfezia claveryi]|nr:hypothetical protein BGX38DRAFT_1224894 [Terfezia claveryi]
MSDPSSQEYYEAIYLLSLLKQLDQSHVQDTDHQTKCAYDIDNEDNSASVDLCGVDVHLESGGSSAVSTSGQRRRLLNALSFIASIDANEQSFTAMTMEQVDNGSALRFRIAMDQSVPQVVMDRLTQVGKLLIQAATKDSGASADGGTSTPTGILSSSAVELELFDLVLRLKQSRLTTDLCGIPGGKDGLLAIFRTAVKTINTTPENHSILASKSAIDRYTLHSQHSSIEDPLAQFQKLIQFVQNTFHHEKGKKAKTKINLSTAKEAILLAYKLRSDQILRQLLSHKAMCGIRNLSRYWWYCLELLRCARSMAFLGKIEFLAVPALRPPSLAGPSASQDLIPTVNRLLTSMGFTLVDLRTYCKHTGLREADVWHGMETSLGTPPYVHAEMTLMHFYTLHTDLQPEREIGCSKNGCFACNNSLKNNLSFKVGKSDTKVYPKRALPTQKPSSKTTVAPTLEARIMPAFIEVLRQALINILRLAPQIMPGQFPSDSELGITTTAENKSVNSSDTVGKIGEPTRMKQGNFTMTLVEDMRAFVLGLGGLMVTDDLEDVEDEGLCKTEADTDASSIPSYHPGAPDWEDPECERCGAATSRKCSKCGSGYFCSTRCEYTAGPHHIFSCTPGRPVDSADYLVQYCYDDLMPPDAEVDGFGFDRCKGAGERSNLLGLYQGIVRSSDTVSSRDLHKWQQENTLAENICRFYDKIPRSHVGGYYPWFEQNKHIVDAKTKKPSLLDSSLNMTALRTWMPKTRRVTDIKGLQNALTEKELDVALLYGLIKASYRPSPGMTAWKSFGFCTCRLEDVIQHDEAELGRLYELLLDKCTWTEFHRAYEGGTLEQLARGKGFAEQIAKLSRSGIFLQPKPYSVYSLKEYVARDDTGVDPELAVMWDYGYLRCRSAREKMQWRNTYKELFESKEYRDEQLHEACIKGKIYGYIKRILPKTPTSFQSLCLNTYGSKGQE